LRKISNLGDEMIELQIFGDNLKEQLLAFVQVREGLTFNRKYSTHDGEVHILIGESYACRTESALTSTVILEFKYPTDAYCTIVSSGGGAGICNIDWGAQDSNEKSIARNIERLAEENDWVIKYSSLRI